LKFIEKFDRRLNSTPSQFCWLREPCLSLRRLWDGHENLNVVFETRDEGFGFEHPEGERNREIYCHLW